MYKDNPKIKFCENHSNFNDICTENNAILLRNFV